MTEGKSHLSNKDVFTDHSQPGISLTSSLPALSLWFSVQAFALTVFITFIDVDVFLFKTIFYPFVCQFSSIIYNLNKANESFKLLVLELYSKVTISYYSRRLAHTDSTK